MCTNNLLRTLLELHWFDKMIFSSVESQRWQQFRKPNEWWGNEFQIDIVYHIISYSQISSISLTLFNTLSHFFSLSCNIRLLLQKYLRGNWTIHLGSFHSYQVFATDVFRENLIMVSYRYKYFCSTINGQRSFTITWGMVWGLCL